MAKVAAVCRRTNPVVEPMLEIAAELVVIVVDIKEHQVAVKQRVAVGNAVMCRRIIGAHHVKLTISTSAGEDPLGGGDNDDSGELHEWLAQTQT